MRPEKRNPNVLPIKYRQRYSAVIDGDYFHYWGFGVDDDSNGFSAPQNLTHPSDQFIGEYDLDAEEIYTNDIVQVARGNEKSIYKVVFKDCKFYGLSNDGDKYGPFTTKLSLRQLPGGAQIKVIGNIYQNPELFK